MALVKRTVRGQNTCSELMVHIVGTRVLRQGHCSWKSRSFPQSCLTLRT